MMKHYDNQAATLQVVSKVPLLPHREIGNIGKVYIPQEVQDQINYLHSKIIGKEWGGLIMYSTTGGNIQDLKDLEFTLHNIYIMNIGTSAFTTYAYGGNVTQMFKTVPDSMEHRIGGIHTHHSMGAFFSGTDIGELVENADKYDYYLSVVVDTKGTYKAKIAIPVTSITNRKITLKDGNGGYYNTTVEDTVKEILIADVTVCSLLTGDVPNWFDVRYDEVLKENTEAVSYITSKYTYRDYNNYYDDDAPAYKPYVKMTYPSATSTYEDKLETFTAKLLGGLVCGKSELPNIINTPWEAHDLQELIDTIVEEAESVAKVVFENNFLLNKRLLETTTIIWKYKQPQNTNNINNLIDAVKEAATFFE